MVFKKNNDKQKIKAMEEEITELRQKLRKQETPAAKQYYPEPEPEEPIYNEKPQEQEQEPIQEVQLKMTTEEATVLLKQNVRRLQVIEQQLEKGPKGIVENSVYNQNITKNPVELINEAEAIKLDLNNLKEILIIKGFTEKTIDGIIRNALNGIKSYQFAIINAY